MNERPPRRRWAVWAAVAALVLPPLSLAPYATSNTELVRLRNALIFDEAPMAAFDWTPENPPVDFLQDRAAPDPVFVRIAEQLKLADLSDDWERALAISRHLLGSAPSLKGGAIQGGLHETYRRITSRGQGYCADFVRVFQAIAVAAGMPTQVWSFSFDGYGGNGHVMASVWSRERGVWQLVDIFNNVYLTRGGSEQPLSARSLREALLSGDPTLQGNPLHEGARPGFAREARLWRYYRRGLHEWYMRWGNNPFTYDQSAAMRSLDELSHLLPRRLLRPLAQLGAIVEGVQPKLVALATPHNEGQRQKMRWLRWHLIAVPVISVAGLAALVLTLRMRGGTRLSGGAVHEG